MSTSYDRPEVDAEIRAHRASRRPGHDNPKNHAAVIGYAADHARAQIEHLRPSVGVAAEHCVAAANNVTVTDLNALVRSSAFAIAIEVEPA